MSIFHITLATLVGAMTVAGIAQLPMVPTPQPMATPVQPLAPPPATARPVSWTEECVLLAVAQGPLPVPPGDLRRIMNFCAAQSIWREKESSR
jgi:hypothetical protein